MPSMRGISTSSMTTSGSYLSILSRAMNGSGAAPTTTMSLSADNISFNRFLTTSDRRIIDLLSDEFIEKVAVVAGLQSASLIQGSSDLFPNLSLRAKRSLGTVRFASLSLAG